MKNSVRFELVLHLLLRPLQNAVYVKACDRFICSKHCALSFQSTDTTYYIYHLSEWQTSFTSVNILNIRGGKNPCGLEGGDQTYRRSTLPQVAR
jgi:hypothetical protein